MTFEYSNLGDRPPGPFVSVAARLLRGVARVQAQRVPFAEAWQQDNLRAVEAGTLADAAPLWVALGDSMTQGLGAPAHDRGWVGQLGRTLADAGRPHRIVNLSVTGARVQDLLDQQLPALDQLAGLGQHPALVTVLIGSNDLMRRGDRDGVGDRYARMLDRLPVGTVVANLPGPSPVAQEIDRQLRDAVRDRGLVLADMRRQGGWRGRLAADHFHPNELGYADLATVFADAIPVAPVLEADEHRTS